MQLGLSQIVIGTHALFEESIQFKQLGLVVIDEQHRFGVHQRLRLQKKGESASIGYAAHQLIMTATPIPRTLAMSRYAHLDLSVIDSLPPNRQPITTIALPQSRRDEIIARIRQMVALKQQVYWVCTLIEESETLTCQAAQDAALELQSHLSDLRVDLVHGKMSSFEKEQIMQDFTAGNIHVLVATTVIEVGVNVPSATLMIIENPERLGLAQLHQLRGRVGRGSQASYCVLLYQPPLSENAAARLGVIRETQDGFKIAEADLQLRGAGEVLGTKQTGAVSFKIADYTRDAELMQTLKEWAKPLFQLSPYAQQAIIDRWCTKPDYAHA
jgi:ATP-dependent DNA helicase RecG